MNVLIYREVDATRGMDLDFFTRNDVPYFNDSPSVIKDDSLQFVNNPVVNGSIDQVSFNLDLTASLDQGS